MIDFYNGTIFCSPAGLPATGGGSLNGVTVFALSENSVIKMKFCGRQARRQKPRHRDAATTTHTAGPLGIINSQNYQNEHYT
jgi:hypothetical protein